MQPVGPGFGAPGKLSSGQFSAENGRQPRAAINHRADFGRRFHRDTKASRGNRTGVRPVSGPGSLREGRSRRTLTVLLVLPFPRSPERSLQSRAASRTTGSLPTTLRRGRVRSGLSGEQTGLASAIPSDGTQCEADCGGAKDTVITAGEGRRFRPERAESAR